MSTAAAMAYWAPTAGGSTVSSAAFTGGTGTVSVGGTLYAKNGAALTLTVNTSSDTKCVDVTGAFTDHQTSSTAKSTWTFSFTAGTGDGVQTATAAASPNFNASNCTGQSKDPQSASLVLDNTGPVVTGVAAPAPNAAGWNNSNVSITWSATDAGSGVASGPTPATDSVAANTPGVNKTSTAADRLGNPGAGSVTVKLDKNAPTISGSRSPAANGNGWNNTDVTVSFTCSDSPSGIKSCTSPSTLSSNAGGQSVAGTAVDNADNSAHVTVSNINIDKVAPTLSGAPTTAPNANGWYNADVAVHWTAGDGLSGLAGSTPADSTISSEGTGLTASASVSDKAGNTTSATSVPAVKIDKTPPNTTATAPVNWNNTDVSVSLNAADALSGVAATHYILDGGAAENGTSLTISAEGEHTLQFWSQDNAGNVEAAKTIKVRIDKTPPTINHTQAPAANANGWNNSDVEITFICGDTLSGIAACTDPVTVTTEGQNQPVTGTATDNAGNSASDPATVNIDKTAPTISAAADRPANGSGWYNDDVTVSYTCGDVLSGIDSCSAPDTLGQGAGQSATGTAKDAAGNTASAGVSDINVDKTAPSISGAPTTAPNADGWYTGDVTIHWTCSDTLSGLDGACPGDSTISGEGDDLSAGASVSDLAGNTANATVSGIRIDRTAPSTLASVPEPLASGWYAGDVLVTLTTGADLSGVDRTYYAVDGGAAQEYTAPFNHSLKGVHTITFWSADKAGNVEDATAPGHSITLKIDGVPPTISGSRTPAANGFGWNNGPVTVSFACSDAESGVAGCSDATTLSNEGAGQSVTGQAQDNAGNTNSATVSDVNIDLTAPTLTGAATTDPNAFGWYKGDVTIHWTGQDGLSGIDPATQPADSSITGEGSDLGVGPVSTNDQAGNTGSGSVSGIKIDRTAPAITGAATTQPNAAGWYHGDVTVDFTCSDPKLVDGTDGSGVASCPTSKLIQGNGVDKSVTSDLATDNAGNTTATGATVSGINIDGAPPVTTADNQCTMTNDWCTGDYAPVVLTATDQADLSGVREIHYEINGGAEQVASGGATTVMVPLTDSGKGGVTYWAVDNAGNAEAPTSVSLKWDNIAPTVTHSLSPNPNAGGWNNSDVTVHFQANDDDKGSGVDVSTITPDVTVTGETAGQAIEGSAKDMAGNLGTDSVTVKLDKTAPSISGAIVSGASGANGWYISAVKIHFTCSDGLAGVATCPDDVTLSSNGANQSVSGTATDKAGNTASATLSGINIDSVAPEISSSSVANGALYTLGAVPASSCTATDGGSGVASCVVTVTGGAPNGVGTVSFTATATDNAGNTTTQTGSYRVIYRWDGFLQPVNDTAHQIGTSTSIFKGGSTVPVKFQLKKADGTVVQSNTAPQWLNPAKGSPTTASVDETAYSDSATSGSTYRYDGTAAQYIYNWSTKGSATGFFYRIGVTLDDGQTYYVSIGLR